MVSITTAGSDRKSIGWVEHAKARKFIEGSIYYEDNYAVIDAAADVRVNYPDLHCRSRSACHG
jgi:hypothetical protein